LVLNLKFYKGIVQYKGTRFYGWQKQPDQRTIQGELEKVVSQINSKADIQVIGSGRTDTGVHAVGQAIKITMPKSFEPDRLKKALNSLLDDDINILSIEECSDDFQPVFSAKSKTYKYFFSNSANKLPQFSDLITYVDFDLDMELVEKACGEFIGEKDFVNFHTVGTPVKTTVREVTECRVEKVVASGHVLYPEDTYVLVISGNGFLKQMVRLIMSAIWSVGRGKTSIEQLQNSFAAKLDQKLAPTAPPQGLYLFEVKY
jgi:tRNA pseudouridine38-40 synthase